MRDEGCRIWVRGRGVKGKKSISISDNDQVLLVLATKLRSREFAGRLNPRFSRIYYDFIHSFTKNHFQTTLRHLLKSCQGKLYCLCQRLPASAV